MAEKIGRGLGRVLGLGILASLGGVIIGLTVGPLPGVVGVFVVLMAGFPIVKVLMRVERLRPTLRWLFPYEAWTGNTDSPTSEETGPATTHQTGPSGQPAPEIPPGPPESGETTIDTPPPPPSQPRNEANSGPGGHSGAVRSQHRNAGVSGSALLIFGIVIGLATLASVIAYSISLRGGIDDLEAQVVALRAEQDAVDYFNQVSIEVTECNTEAVKVEVKITNAAPRTLLVDWYTFDTRSISLENLPDVFELLELNGLSARRAEARAVRDGELPFSRTLSLVPPGTLGIVSSSHIPYFGREEASADCAAAILDVSLPGAG